MDEKRPPINGTGNDAHHSQQAPLPSAVEASGISPGAPVESSKQTEASTGAPPEPLVVVDETPAQKPVKLKPKMRLMLAALSKTGNVTAASKKARLARADHYNWLNAVDAEGNPTPLAQAYAIAAEIAMDEAVDRLESEARRRAEKGTLKPVFYEGVECGTIREYSDTLLIFLLKAARPAKYRDRYEVTGAGGKPINPERVDHYHKLDLSILQENELEDYTRLLSKLSARGEPRTLPGKN